MDLKKQIEEDLEITEKNLLSKNFEITRLFNKYNLMYISILKKYKKIKNELNLLYKQKYHYYKFDFNYGLSSKAEIDLYVKGDNDYIKKSDIVDDCYIKLKMIENTLEEIKNVRYHVSNIIKIKTFMSGD